jgi:tetratricopeptide (TPR) repeat protein
MDENFKNLVIQAVKDHDIAIFEDSRGCKAMLSDYVRGNYRGDIQFLFQLLEEGCYRKICDQRQDLEITKLQLVQKLHGDFHFDKTSVREMLDFLASIVENFGTSSIAAYFSKAKSFETSNDYPHAIEAYTQIINQDSNNYKAYTCRGILHDVQGDYDNAIADFAEVIRILPNNSFSFYNRGNAYKDKGRFEEALNDFSYAIKFDPKAPFAYYARGGIYLIRGNLEKAEIDLAEAKKYGLLPDKEGHVSISKFIIPEAK